jgi:hypothetical protein
MYNVSLIGIVKKENKIEVILLLAGMHYQNIKVPQTTKKTKHQMEPWIYRKVMMSVTNSSFASKKKKATEANRKRGTGTREKVRSKRINLEGNTHAQEINVSQCPV